MRRAIIAVCLLAAGCGRYADFTLPTPSPGKFTPRVFRWEAESEPVMGRGSGWESGDVLNPSVVRLNGKLVNYYSGFDGKAWHTGVAESNDGLHWDNRRLILSPKTGYIAANGSALAVNGQIRHWYEAGGRERLYIELEGKLVLETGPRGSWDERAVADPYVIREGDRFYMYFLGQDRARRQRLGVAQSHDGVVWEKLRGNPILELGEDGAFDENGLGEPAVWQSHGSYWMLYTGRDRQENRRIGLARSPDGVRWERVSGAVFAGKALWMSKVICDPTVLVEGDVVRVWFGGGDVASPDENLHGQIGYARLVMLP